MTLYGPLSSTEIGHSTGKAISLELMWFAPGSIDTDEGNQLLATQILNLAATHMISFSHSKDIIFIDTPLEYHPKAMTFKAFLEDNKCVYTNAYYSVGEGHIDLKQADRNIIVEDRIKVPLFLKVLMSYFDYVRKIAYLLVRWC